MEQSIPLTALSRDSGQGEQGPQPFLIWLGIAEQDARVTGLGMALKAHKGDLSSCPCTKTYFSALPNVFSVVRLP